MDEVNHNSQSVKALRQSLPLTGSFLKLKYISRLSKYYNLARAHSRYIKRPKGNIIPGVKNSRALIFTTCRTKYFYFIKKNIVDLVRNPSLNKYREEQFRSPATIQLL